jgi:WASH complex subunit 7, N-terminal
VKVEDEARITEGDVEVMTSRMLYLYRNVYEVLYRLSFIVVNILHQLSIIFDKNDPTYKEIFKHVQFNFILDILGRALSLFYKVDCVV